MFPLHLCKMQTCHCKSPVRNPSVTTPWFWEKFKLKKKKCIWMCQLLCGTRDPHCFIWGLSLQCTDSLVVAHGLSSCGARAPECAGFLPCMWAPWRPGSGSPFQSRLHLDSRHFCLFLRKAPKNYTLWFCYYKDEYISIRCFSIKTVYST